MKRLLALLFLLTGCLPGSEPPREIVPNLIGMRVSAAHDAVTVFATSVASRERAPCAEGSQVVVRQSPKPGAIAREGSTIMVTPGCPAGRAVAQVHASYDDAVETCVRFTLDGSPQDPRGTPAIRFLRAAWGTELTLGRRNGRRILCAVSNVGSKDCSFRLGHWTHLIVSGGGKTTRVPNTLSYRVHPREIDAWLWQGPDSPRYAHVGTTFREACTD